MTELTLMYNGTSPSPLVIISGEASQASKVGGANFSSFLAKLRQTYEVVDGFLLDKKTKIIPSLLLKENVIT